MYRIRAGREQPQEEDMVMSDREREREQDLGGQPDGGFDADVEQHNEELIEHAEGPMATFGTTAEEQRRGQSLDSRLADEGAGSPTETDDLEVFSDDTADEESELVGEAAAEQDPFLAPEDGAMSVRGDAPGAVDHPDDYVDEDLAGEAGNDQA
jgi:hypothetical protein